MGDPPTEPRDASSLGLVAEAAACFLLLCTDATGERDRRAAVVDGPGPARALSTTDTCDAARRVGVAEDASASVDIRLVIMRGRCRVRVSKSQFPQLP
jgi:hypothetical protein